MAQNDSRIEKLVELFAEFERDKYSRVGHEKLVQASSLASEILLDVTAGPSHAKVREIVARWVERIQYWDHAQPIGRELDHETLRLFAANLELFNDDLFELPGAIFDPEGFLEFLAISRKPAASRTASERRYLHQFVDRFTGRNQDGQS